MTPKERHAEIGRFQAWLKTIPRDRLENLVVDAFWKGQLQGAELERFFPLEERGIRMIPV